MGTRRGSFSRREARWRVAGGVVRVAARVWVSRARIYMAGRFKLFF